MDDFSDISPFLVGYVIIYFPLSFFFGKLHWLFLLDPASNGVLQLHRWTIHQTLGAGAGSLVPRCFNCLGESTSGHLTLRIDVDLLRDDDGDVSTHSPWLIWFFFWMNNYPVLYGVFWFIFWKPWNFRILSWTTVIRIDLRWCRISAINSVCFHYFW